MLQFAKCFHVYHVIEYAVKCAAILQVRKQMVRPGAYIA